MGLGTFCQIDLQPMAMSATMTPLAQPVERLDASVDSARKLDARMTDMARPKFERHRSSSGTDLDVYVTEFALTTECGDVPQRSSWTQSLARGSVLLGASSGPWSRRDPRRC